MSDYRIEFEKETDLMYYHHKFWNAYTQYLEKHLQKAEEREKILVEALEFYADKRL